MDRIFHDSPFQARRIADCRIDESGLFCSDEEKKSIELSPDEDVLLLEAVYQTNVKDHLFARTRPEIRFQFERDEKPNILNDIESFKVLFLYQKNNPVPLQLIDVFMDYSFLKNAKSFSSMINFNYVKQLFEKFFHKPINRDMVHYAYSLLPSPTINEVIQKIKVSKKREKERKKISNENSVNLMSRLMFGQWSAEMGWADGIVSF
jgi:hypothetical protein